MVHKSAESFANLVILPCELCLPCNDDYVWDSNFILSPFKSQYTALFNLILKMNEDMAYYNQESHIFGVGN